MKLDKKTIILSGAVGGIGMAIAERCLAHGAQVAMLDVADVAEGAAKAQSLDPSGARARYWRVDVTDRAASAAALDEAAAAWGGVDGLVNNAAILRKGDFLTLSDEDFDAVYAVNLKGYFVLGQEAAKRMGDGGAIVNLSSVNGQVAITDQTAYSVMKGGVNQLTRAMALTLAPLGLRANAIAPGSIATDMFRTVVANPDAYRTVMSRTPLGRPGEPSEVGELAAFLLSSESAYITGEVIVIDGGRMALNYVVPVKE